MRASHYKRAGAEVPSDLQQIVEFVIQSHPELTDPEQRRRFNEALSNQIESPRPRKTEIHKSEISAAKKMTSVATAFSGGATAALIAALAVPGAPELAIVAIGLIGLLVSKYIADAIDNFVEKRPSLSHRSTV